MKPARTSFRIFLAFGAAGLTFLACSHKYETIEARYIEDSEYRLLADLNHQEFKRLPAEDSLLALAPARGLADAVALYRQGELDRAAELLERFLAEDKRDWRAAYYIGRVNTCRKDYVRADSCLHQSLEYCPHDEPLRALIYAAMGENCEAQGDLGRARQHFVIALYLNPKSSSASEGLKRLRLLAEND